MKYEGFLLRGVHDTEAGSSSIVGNPSAPPSKKSKLTVDLNVLAKEWDIIIDEVREVMIENNVAIREIKKLQKENVCPLNLLKLLLLLMKVLMIKSRKFSYSIIT